MTTVPVRLSTLKNLAQNASEQSIDDTDTSLIDPTSDVSILTSTRSTSNMKRNGVLKWITTIGWTNISRGYDIATDTQGNIYVTGTYNSQPDVYDTVGNVIGQLRNSYHGVFVMKLNNEGNILWVNSLDGAAPSSVVEYGCGIAVDKDGNVFTTGYYQSSDTQIYNTSGATIAQLRTPTSNAAYIIKFSPSGVFNWSVTLDGLSSEYGSSIATDNDGNILAAGHYNTSGGNVTVYNHSGSLISSFPPSVQSVAYICKLNTNGGYIWGRYIKGFGANGTPYAQTNGIAIDDNNNIYWRGNYTEFPAIYNESGNQIGSLRLVLSGWASFLIKLNATGGYLWSNTWVDANGIVSDLYAGVSVDLSGNVYTTGRYSLSCTIYTMSGSVITLKSSPQEQAYFLKFSPQSQFLWSSTLGGVNSAHGKDIVVDKQGSIYATGIYNGTGSQIFNHSGVPLATLMTVTGGFGNGDAAYYLKFNISGVLEWVTIMEGEYINDSTGICTDNNGNVYATGYYSGSGVQLFNVSGVSMAHVRYSTGYSAHIAYVLSLSAGGIFTNAAPYSLVSYPSRLNISKPDGLLQWAYTIDGTSADRGVAIASDSDGNVYAGGYYSWIATIYTPSGNVVTTLPSMTSETGYIVKYNISGVYQWNITVGNKSSTAWGRINGLHTDKFGNVYATGYYGNPARVYGASGNEILAFPTPTSNASFILKISPSGTVHWTRIIDGNNADSGISISTDTMGNAYAFGVHQSSGTRVMDASGTQLSTLRTVEYEGAYLCKFSTSGNITWSVVLDCWSNDYPKDIDVDTSGNVLVTGGFNGGPMYIYDPSGTVASQIAGGTCAYLIKFNPNGMFQWHVRVDGSVGGYNEISNAVSVDNSGDVYITGAYFFTGILYNTSGQSIANLSDVGGGSGASYLIKITSNGAFLWARIVNGSSQDVGMDVVADIQNNVYVTGNYTLRNSPPFPILDQNNNQVGQIRDGSLAYILKFNSSGAFQWSTTIDNANNAVIEGVGIDVDERGNVYATGFATGTGLVVYNHSGTAVMTFPDMTPFSGAYILSLSTGGTVNVPTTFTTPLETGTVKFIHHATNSNAPYALVNITDPLGTPLRTHTLQQGENITLSWLNDDWVTCNRL